MRRWATSRYYFSIVDRSEACRAHVTLTAANLCVTLYCKEVEYWNVCYLFVSSLQVRDSDRCSLILQAKCSCTGGSTLCRSYEPNTENTHALFARFWWGLRPWILVELHIPFSYYRCWRWRWQKDSTPSGFLYLEYESQQYIYIRL